MSKYIGSSAVNLSTTSADVTGNADIDGNLTVGGNLTVSGTTITVDHASAQTVDLGDGDKIRLGADYELQLWSDGTTGQISGDINHTGSLTTDGLTVDGTTGVTVSGLYPTIFFGETDTTDLNTRLRTSGGSLNISTVNDAYTGGVNRFNIDHSTGDISFYDTSGNAKFLWDASEESVTIGPATTTVGNLLLTKAGGTEYANMFFANSRTYQLGTGGASTGDYANKFYIYDSTAGAPRLSLDSSGKFGLGTMNPSHQLTLYKSDSGQTQIQFQNATTGTTTADGFGVGLDTQEEAFLWSYDSNDIYFGGSTSGVAVRIDGSDGGVKVEKKLTVKNQNALYFDNTGGYSPRLSNASDQSALSSFINNSESLRLNSSCLSIFSSGQFANTYGNSTRTNLQIDGSGEAILTMSIGGAMAGYVNAGSTDMVVAAKTGSKIRLIPNGSTANEVQITTGGNIVMKNGTGIDFGASAGGNSTSTTLGDYEEGTWTITSENAGVSNPSTVRGKLYTKIGRLVTVSIEFVVPSNSVAQQAIFGGLPFASSNLNTYRDVGSAEGHSSSTFSYVLNNANSFYVYGADFSSVTYQALSNQTIIINLTYMAA